MMSYSMEVSAQRLQFVSSSLQPAMSEESSFCVVSSQNLPSQRLSHFVPLQQSVDDIEVMSRYAARLSHSTPSLAPRGFVEEETYHRNSHQCCPSTQFETTPLDPIQVVIPQCNMPSVWQCYELTDRAQYALTWQPSPLQEQPNSNTVQVHYHSYAQGSLIIENEEPTMTPFFPSSTESIMPGLKSCDHLGSDTNSASLNNLHSATTVLPGLVKHPKMSTTSSSSYSSSSLKHQSRDALTNGGIVPRSGHPPEMARSGGGRHPHPPVGNNSKLKHMCPFDGCPWRFATPYKLRRHIKSHTKETPYLCKECGRGFSVRYNLLMHIQTIHSQPQRFKCPVRGCKDAFHSQSRLNGHLRRIHKNDWKSLQGVKEPSKTSSRRGGSISSTDSSDSIPATSMPNRKQKPANTVHKCQKCGEEFTSKAKLTVHNKTHNQGKELLKCTVQDCEKAFSSQDKLNRHMESHNKRSKQLSCPHKNCNRLFLTQAHLRSHLRIHTQDHQFICPVLDCSQKFSSESAYNVHLNTHINFGYTCPFSDCKMTFPFQKRLNLHIQVVHGSKQQDSENSLLEGIQPHLGEHLERHSDPSLMSPSSSTMLHPSPSSSVSKNAAISYIMDKDFIKHVDLPGLSVDDIEAVLSENKDWSGEQIDQFLRSAIDLCEIESKLANNDESDSGYSTYDVSPITSNAPANLSFSRPQVTGPQGGMHPASHTHHSCPPPSLGLLEHSNSSPLFNNPPFMSLPLQSQPSVPSSGLVATSPTGAPPLIHDPICSPCPSDGGFFSPHSVFNTPSHDPITFFPSHSPVSLYPPQGFPPPQDFIQAGRASNNSNMFSPSGQCFPDAMHNIGLPMQDPFLHDLCQSHMPPPFGTPTATGPPFMECSHNDIHFPAGMNVKMEGGTPCLGGVPMEMELVPPLPILKQEEEELQSVATNRHPLSIERNLSLECTTMSPTSPLSVSSHVSQTTEQSNACFSPAPLVSSSTTSEKIVTPSPPSAPVHSTCAQPAQPAAGRCSPTVTSSSSSSNETLTSDTIRQRKSRNPSRTQGKGVVMKAKKKGQWPRSMSKANLLAFRELILNNLKKGQEVAAGPSQNSISLEITKVKNPSACEDEKPSSTTMPLMTSLVNYDASSPKSMFEGQVMDERNPTTGTTKRCLSEPADMNELLHPIQNEQRHSSSTGNIHDDLAFSCSSAASSPALEGEKFWCEEANNLLSDLNFNPDVLLSSNLDERVLDSLGFRFDTPEDEDVGSSDNLSNSDVEIASLLSRTEASSFPSTSSPPSSMVGMSSAMDIDCIQDFLIDSVDSTAPASSPPQSLGNGPASPSTKAASESCPSSAPAVVGGNSANTMFQESLLKNEKPSNRMVDYSSSSQVLQFSEIFSVEGSMTLNEIGQKMKEEPPHFQDCNMREAFLRSTHDPLLTTERHSVTLFDAI